MRIKSILFDFDDTLITTFETKKEALKYLAREVYGLEIEDEQIRSNWGKPIEILFRSIFKGVEDIDKVIKEYTELRINFPTKAYPDTLTTLEELSNKYLLGIITSNIMDYLSYDLRLTGINRNLFFTIQTAEKCKYHKPDPKVFDYTLEVLNSKGISKSEVLYIGDTLLDYYAARDAGINFYGLPDRTVLKNDFDKAGAMTIPSISSLLRINKLLNIPE